MQKYVAFLRLRPWQTWPTGTTSWSRDLAFGQNKAKVHLFVTGHDAESAKPGNSPGVWRYEALAKIPSIVGAKIIFAVGEKQGIPIKDGVTNAYPSEIDIVCAIECDADIPSLKTFAESMAWMVMAHLQMVFDDAFTLVGPMGDGELKSIPFDVLVRPRRSITFNDIGNALTNASQSVKAGGTVWEHPAITSIAVRRFLRGETGLHHVDRYLDYWLTCEVLTSNLGGKDEAPHSKIAKGLAPHIRKEKKIVENALGLANLAKRRDDIVHGKRDNVPADDFAMLKAIAGELLRKELGLPYLPEGGDKNMETALSRYEQARIAAKKSKKN